MTPRPRLAPLLLLAALLLNPAPAAAGPPSGAEALRDQAFDRVEAVRAGLRGTNVGPALEAAVELSGVRPVIPPASPVPLPPATPSGLREPLADLLGALKAAQESARGAIHIEVAAALEAIRQADALRRPHRFGEIDAQTRSALDALAERHAGAFDRPRMYGGALALARAIDRALPALRAYAASAAHPTGAAPCDVLDASPALCVGGTDANVYTDDVWLQIDLGGNDVYRNSAGVGSVLPPAAAVLDLGGDDLYERAAGNTTFSQGSALLGIGLLVDTAGNDRYIVRAAPSDAAESLMSGQAYAAFGVGALVDAAGNDTYEASGTVPVGKMTVKAQGYAEFGGLALLLDGSGDDDYVVRSAPPSFTYPHGSLQAGAAVAGGQGFGLIAGVALVADGGGSDDVTVEALTSEISPGETKPHATVDATTQAGAYAFYGGTSVVLTGPGETRWSVRAISRGSNSGWSQVDALAMASFGGMAAIGDAGGNDTYSMEGRSSAVRELDAAICGCSAVGPGSTTTVVAGEGAGEAGGVGLIAERAGSDRYLSVATTISEASIIDERVEGADPFLAADAKSGSATSAAQGVGGVGTGFLLDTAGDDTYESNATSEARAIARSADPSAELQADAAADEGASLAQAHGAVGGYGELRDLGGADAYRTTNLSTAIAEPAGSTSALGAISSVQGSTFGGVPPYLPTAPAMALLLDLDAGATDTFTAVPADAACVGTRGQGAWSDCGLGVAGGVNA